MSSSSPTNNNNKEVDDGLGGALDMLPDDDDVMAAVTEAAVQAVTAAQAPAAALPPEEQIPTVSIVTVPKEEEPKEKETKEDTAGGDDPDYVPPPSTATEKKPAQPRKRVRRVGRAEPRKEIKLVIDQEKQQLQQQAAAAAGTAPPAIMVAVQDGTAVALPNLTVTAFKVQSKHDEKWNKSFEALLKYKEQHGDTLVPQCYDRDPRLGRWVHYQRVEYWLYQSTGKAKISAERIARLESIGFEWDPQSSKWKGMFEKLKAFTKEHGHCKVPKGYAKDIELANWVRNQRLEYANMQRKKKNRMTKDRIDALNSISFAWSTPGTPSSSRTAARRKSAATKAKKNETTTLPKEESTWTDPAQGEAPPAAAAATSENQPVDETLPPVDASDANYI